jgi:hypothetical protein
MEKTCQGTVEFQEINFSGGRMGVGTFSAEHAGNFPATVKLTALRMKRETVFEGFSKGAENFGPQVGIEGSADMTLPESLPNLVRQPGQYLGGILSEPGAHLVDSHLASLSACRHGRSPPP